MPPAVLLIVGVSTIVVALVGWGCAHLFLRHQQRKLDAAKARQWRAKVDGIILDGHVNAMTVMLARSEGARRARQARLRIAQRRLLLK